MDPEKLLVKVSLGKKLSASEFDDIVHALSEIDLNSMARTGLVDEAYALLHLLGRAKAYQHIQLMEKYLGAKDPLLVSMILEVLCLDWGRAEDYIERLIDFSLGVSWDEEEDVRQTALKILGEYLRPRLFAEPVQEKKKSGGGRRAALKPEDAEAGQKPKRVLELLLGILADVDLSHSLRQTAYLSLGRASGKEWQELPSECAILNLEKGTKDLDLEMLERLGQLLISSS